MKKNVLKWLLPLFALSMSMKVMAVEVEITDHTEGGLSDEITAELGDEPDFAAVTKLTISGGNLNADDATFLSSTFKTTLEELDISGITFDSNHLTPNLCKEMSALKKVTFPQTLNKIGQYSFFKCTNLEQVIWSKVNDVDNYAFQGCSKLVLTSLPENIARVGQYGFSNCSNIEISEFPASLNGFGVRAFEFCAKLTIKEIHSGITSLNERVFDRTGIREFTFSDNLASIGHLTFYVGDNPERTFICRRESAPTLGTTSFGPIASISNTTVKVLKKHAGNYSAWVTAGMTLAYLTQDITVNITGNGAVSVAGDGLVDDEGAVSDGSVIKAYEAEDIVFTCTPEEGYLLETTLWDEEEIASGQTLTIDGKAQKTLTVTFVQDTSTGIGTVENGDIQIRYNQQTNIAELSGRLNTPVLLFNGVGRCLLETTENRIDLTGYNPGLYILKAGSKTMKLLKK